MIIQVTQNDGDLIALTDKGVIFRKTANDKWREIELPEEDK